MAHAVVVTDPIRSRLDHDVVCASLREAGCSEVEHASSIEAAVALAAETRPAVVVILAEHAPDPDDCHRLIVRMRGAPVVAIVPETAIQSAFDAGVDDCVARPIRRTELVSRLRTAMQLGDRRNRQGQRDRKLSDEVRALQREKDHLERISCVDGLTGVANRRHALGLLEAEWKRSLRDGTTLALVMIDLDFFHAFNATYGHPGGDACLRRVTAEMVMCLRRPSDFLGRYGGEEFIAVLANTDAGGARIVAERLRAAVEALGIAHRSSRCAKVVTASVGFAAMQAMPDLSVEALVQAADRALYAAKSQGRNRVCGEAAFSPPRPHPPDQPWRRFPIVVVEPWFASRIPTFFAATRSELVQAREAADGGDFDRIRAIARRLKADAAAHGLEVIGKLAQLLDRAARADDRAAVDHILDELRLYIDHVQVTYRRHDEATLDQAH